MLQQTIERLEYSRCIAENYLLIAGFLLSCFVIALLIYHLFVSFHLLLILLAAKRARSFNSPLLLNKSIIQNHETDIALPSCHLC